MSDLAVEAVTIWTRTVVVLEVAARIAASALAEVELVVIAAAS